MPPSVILYVCNAPMMQVIFIQKKSCRVSFHLWKLPSDVSCFLSEYVAYIHACDCACMYLRM